MIQKTKRSIEWIAKNTFPFFPKKEKYAGLHLIADFWNVKDIEDEREMKELLVGSAKAAGSTVLEVLTYKFSPQGITGVVLLAESHIAIHTWPEIGYAAVDVFTCGDKARPEIALDYLKGVLQPKRIDITKLKRGRAE